MNCHIYITNHFVSNYSIPETRVPLFVDFSRMLHLLCMLL